MIWTQQHHQMGIQTIANAYHVVLDLDLVHSVVELQPDDSYVNPTLPMTTAG
jgi:hypothetical protein